MDSPLFQSAQTMKRKTINKTDKDSFLFPVSFFLCMASTDRKYSIHMLVCSREAWLHGKPKDSGGNIPSLEVAFSDLHSKNDH